MAENLALIALTSHCQRRAIPLAEGIRGETAGPRRYGRRRGRPKIVVPTCSQRMEVDYAALDTLLADTNRVVERVQLLLKSR